MKPFFIYILECNDGFYKVSIFKILLQEMKQLMLNDKLKDGQEKRK